jgi:hypothetical protein
MVPASFVDFFVAAVGVTGALIGLLFVAVSLAPRRMRDEHTSHLAQSQASAALLVFTNTLTVGMFALFPGSNLGWPTLIIGVLGIVYSFSVGRLALARTKVDRAVGRSLGRIAAGICLISGFETAAGLRLVLNGENIGAVYTVAGVMVAFVLFGISRAWELVGLQDNGLFHSLAVLRRPEAADPKDGPEEPGGL